MPKPGTVHRSHAARLVLAGALAMAPAPSALAFDFDWSALGWADRHLHEHFSNVDGSGIGVTVDVSGSTRRLESNSPEIDQSIFELEPNFGHRYESIVVKFTFSEPVVVTGFNIRDLDSRRDDGDFEEQDEVIVNAAGGTVVPTMVSLGSEVDRTSQDRFVSDGGSSSGPNDPDGVVTMNLDSTSFTELTVVYKPGPRSENNPSRQEIYIGDFQFDRPAAPASLSVTKTANTAGPIDPGDQITYTVTITNDGGGTETGITITDPIDPRTTYIAQSTVVQGFQLQAGASATFADDFRTRNYSGNQGSHRFSDRWHEQENSHHHGHFSDGHNNGEVRVVTHNGSPQLELRLRRGDDDDEDDDDDDDSNSIGDWVYRQLDLSGYGGTSLSFDYDCTGSWDSQGRDRIVLEAYNGSNWSVLRTYNSNCSPSTETGVDLTPFESSHTRIRFRVAAARGSDAEFFVDNVLITAGGSSVVAVTRDNIPGGSNPDLVNGVPQNIVVGGDGFQLEPGQSMTASYTVQALSRQGRTTVDNTATVTSNELTTSPSASVSIPRRRYDYGDAPQSYGEAAHERIPGNGNASPVYLGAANSGRPDSGENGSQFTADASGDDAANRDDEEGVTFSTIAATQTVSAAVTVTVNSGTPTLCAWLDIDVDGAFDTGERRCTTAPPGTNVITIDWDALPTGAATSTFARFRVGTDAASVAVPIGSSGDGEVEDHPVTWDFPVSDFGDTPANGSVAPSGDPSAYGNPEHRIDPALHLGAGDPDDEASSINSALADGDDTTDSADENGLVLLDASQVGDLVDAAIQVTNTTGAAVNLCAWLDGFGDAQGIPDGSFDAANGQCTSIADQSIDQFALFRFDADLPNGVFTPLGDTYLRLRLSSDPGMTTASGNAGALGVGEVEDHFVPGSYDFGDAPAVYGDASHALPKTSSQTTAVQSFLFLGSLPSTDRPDADPGSQAIPNDDSDGLDDENAVTFSAPGGSGNSVFATVNAANLGATAATVCAWLDRDGTGPFAAGDLADGGCQTVAALSGASLSFQWSGLTTASQVSTFARFRISSSAAEAGAPTGRARDGEVEDYPITFDLQPTAVTIGSIEARMVSVASVLGPLDIGASSTAGLFDLLSQWAPDEAGMIDAGNRHAINAALRSYLDSDGDGFVAVLRWSTLEERGTVGFYVERRGVDGWVRLNPRLLPAMIPAPLGAQYRLYDPGARPGQRHEYRIIEQEARGALREYGPFVLELE